MCVAKRALVRLALRASSCGVTRCLPALARAIRDRVVHRVVPRAFFPCRALPTPRFSAGVEGCRLLQVSEPLARSLLATDCSLPLTTHYSLHTTHYTLLATHAPYLLHTANFSLFLLPNNYFLTMFLTTYYVRLYE